MHYSRFLPLLALFLGPILAAPVHPEQPATVEDNYKKLTEPPKHGDFVGVRPAAYEEKTPENNRLNGVSIHPGVVIDGPHADTGAYSVAMISKKLPHNPPQKPIKDFHPKATTYGNVALSPPKTVPMENMRVWISKETTVREKPMEHHNVEKLKHAMTPHANWRPPTPPPKAPTPPPQRLSKKKPQVKGPPTTGMRHPLPPRPQGAQIASGSNHPAASRIAASNSKHPAAGGSNHQGPKASKRPGSPLKRPGSPSRRPGTPSGRPGTPSRRPASPSRRPASPLKGPTSPPKRPGSPSRRPSSPGPRPQSRQSKGKKPASTSPRPAKKGPGVKR